MSLIPLFSNSFSHLYFLRFVEVSSVLRATFKRLNLLISALCLFFWGGAASYGQISITAATVSENDFRLNEQTASYSFTITGTTPGTSRAEATVKPYWYIIYATGTDIYGNPFYQVLSQGFTQTLYGPTNPPQGARTEATSQTLAGSWGTADSTLLNYFPLRPVPARNPPHRIVLALYGDGNPATAATQPPIDDRAFASPALSRAAGAIYFFTNNGPDLAIEQVTYNAGSYTGGDIIRMTTKWRNNSFTLIPTDVYKIHSYLTENAAIDWRPPPDPLNPDDSVRPDNDDFLLSEYTISGDRPVASPVDTTPVIPDGKSVVRKIEVVPVGPLVTYGIPNENDAAADPFYGSTLRVYQPQPADGYLDVGEVVSVTVEVQVPENYAGTYFVAGRVDPENTVPEPPNLLYIGSNLYLEIQDPSLRRPDNNTFVGNASAKITIDGPTTSPTVEAVSAIAFEDGEYVQGGGETSNQSSVSADGNVIAFSSAARNLLVPPQLGEAFIQANGRGADMTLSPQFTGNLQFGPIGDFLTAGQQIFYRLRQTREIYLASGLDGITANANCFNPSISSATGRYIAFDSRANNLGERNTGNRSLIYITDAQGQTIKAIRPDANGDCFNPSISANGRFVAFESVATNLDTANPIPAGNSSQQIYLHDRDVDGAGPKTFDQPGNTATYLVSVDAGEVADGDCLTPSLSAWEPPRTGSDVMYVAFTSYASNLPSGGGGEQVYRVKVNVGTASPGAGPVDLVSINGATPPEPANKPQGAPNGSIEPSISGDGSQVAFSSSANNLVYNSSTGAWDGDSNLVPDVFVRDFITSQTVRVSASIERVATGIISFVGPSLLVPGNGSLVNIPQNNPRPGDTLRITSSGATETFVFGPFPGVPVGPDVPVAFPQPPNTQLVLLGKDVCATRDNLIAAINARRATLGIVASATTPTALPGAIPPNMAVTASVYLRSEVLGEAGNGTITFTGAAPVVVDTDLTGGGVQAEDAPLAVQGVPAGSNQPSISEDGRVVAFRTIAGNLDVQALTAENNIPGGPPYTDLYPPSPRQGELIRPVRFPASNIYVRNRSVDEDFLGGEFDLPGNVSTTKISVNNFGYPTTVSAQQGSGFGAFTTAANQAPAVGGNGRVITFSSGSEAFGGLVFGRNNLEPLDFQNARDVYVYDSQDVGTAPPPTESRPEVTLLSPSNDLRVQPGSTIALAASVIPKLGKTISSVQFYINGAPFGAPLTSEPYSLTYRLANPGQYIVRVVATDSRGITGVDSAIITAGPPPSGEDAPLVALTQPPSQVSNYVIGSDLVLNAFAEDPDATGAGATGQVTIASGQVEAVNVISGGSGYSAKTKVFFIGGGGSGAEGSVAVDSGGKITSINITKSGAGYTSAPSVVFSTIERVTFYLNGQPYEGTRSFDGNWSAPFRPSKTGANSLFAEAVDVDNNIGLSEISTIVFWGIGDTFPTVEIIRNNDGLPAVAGGTYPLRARVTFQSPSFSFDAANSAVLFYADGVYVGLGTLQSDDTYLLNWNLPETPRSYSKIYAYLSAPNFFFLADGGNDGGSPTLYASVVVRSKNFLTLTTEAGLPLSVNMTKPISGAQIPAGVPTLLEATALAPNGQGTISRVEFYQNGELIGQADEAFPYQIEFTPAAPGRYELVALAYSTAGVIKQSAAVTVNAVQGASPNVDLEVSGGRGSQPVAVPNLAAAKSGTDMLLTFIAMNGVNYVLEETTNLHSTVWTVSNTPLAVSSNQSGVAQGYTRMQATVPLSGARNFYRLSYPPTAGNNFSVNQTANLVATADDSDGTVARVEFLVNGVVVQTVNASPYLHSYQLTAPGRYEIVARAYDNLGNVNDSAAKVITVTDGAAPTVEITNPANTLPVTEVSPGIPVSVTVNASDSDGSVARVELLVNGVVVGFSTQAPFIFTDAGQFSGGTNTTFTPTSEGLYVIVARATDNLGNVSDSDPVTVRAKSPTPVGIAPTVQITQPIGEIYYVTGSSLFLNARATDAAPGTVDPDSVEFTVNGLPIPGAAVGRVGNAYGVRYTLAVPFTIDTIRAQASDNDGNTTYSQPNYTVLTLAQAPLPQVQMLELLPGQPQDAGGEVTLRAEAIFPPTANQQARVEFYANNVYVGTGTQDSTNPRLYTLAWETPEDSGSYAVEARAVALNFQTNTGDDNVIEYFSSVISDNSIAVNTIPGNSPIVAITTPLEGASINANQPVTITASASVPGNVSITPPAQAVGLTVTSVPVSIGSAVSVDDPLYFVSFFGSPVAVKSTVAGEVVSVVVKPGDVITSGMTTMTIKVPAAGGTIDRVEFYANGALVGSDEAAPYASIFTPESVGLYNLAALAYSDAGLVGTSALVSVSSVLGIPPTVSLVGPEKGVVGQSARLVATPSINVSQAGRNIAQVEFVVNGFVVETLTAANEGSAYVYNYPVTAPGNYQIQARATDNVGNVAISNTLDLPTRDAPTVVLVAPTTASIGQTVTLTATATTPVLGARITSVEFLVNGSVIASDTTPPYSANYTVPAAGDYTLQARAVDSEGISGLSNVVEMAVAAPPPPDPTAPTVTFVSPTAGSNVFLGNTVPLLAVASPGQGASITSVVFSILNPNGGLESKLATNSGSGYAADFVASLEGVYTITVTATNNLGKTATSQVVVISQTTPPVPPGSNQAFVLDMYRKILGREPSPLELNSTVAQLDSGEISRADFTLTLVEGEEYANNQNRVADFYYTLGVTPSFAAFSTRIAEVKADPALMTGFDDYYPGVIEYWAAPPPFGATLGQVNAARALTQNAGFVARSLGLTGLVNWMWARLGGATANDPAVVTSRLGSYATEAEKKGAIVSFLTANYENIGSLNQSMDTAELAYQYQLRATTLRFLLGGPWQPTTTAGTSAAANSRLANLQVTSQASLLSFIERLLAESTIVLVAPGSATATGAARIGGGLTNISITSAGTSYQPTNPPAVTIAAPLASTAMGTGMINASTGVVTNVALTNNTNGFYSTVPAVTVRWPDDPFGSTATAVAQIATNGTNVGRVTNIVVTSGGSGYSTAPWVRIEAPGGTPELSPIQAVAGTVGVSGAGQITNITLGGPVEERGGSGYRTTNPAVLVGAPPRIQLAIGSSVTFSNRMLTNSSLFSVGSYVLLTNSKPAATNATGSFTFTNSSTNTNGVTISVRAISSTNGVILGESPWTTVTTNSP